MVPRTFELLIGETRVRLWVHATKQSAGRISCMWAHGVVPWGNSRDDRLRG